MLTPRNLSKTWAFQTTLIPAAVTETIFHGALQRGLLLMGYFSRVRINPPLILTEAEADEGVAILDEVFGEVARSGAYRR